jgi:hypothetical protein
MMRSQCVGACYFCRNRVYGAKHHADMHPRAACPAYLTPYLGHWLPLLHSPAISTSTSTSPITHYKHPPSTHTQAATPKLQNKDIDSSSPRRDSATTHLCNRIAKRARDSTLCLKQTTPHRTAPHRIKTKEKPPLQAVKPQDGPNQRKLHKPSRSPSHSLLPGKTAHSIPPNLARKRLRHRRQIHKA